jgi:hypothetical protein
VIPIEKNQKRVGRIGKFAEWLTDDGLLRVQGWAREGLIDEQIAHNMGIGYSTFREWLAKFPALAAALKKGKAPVDIEVENALLKRALGYECEETTTEIFEMPDGSSRKHIRKTLKHIPPDTTAQIFWLKNRKPGRWRDKIEAPPEAGNELLQALLDLERRAQA